VKGEKYMQALEIVNSMQIIESGEIEGIGYVVVDCLDYDEYRALPDAIKLVRDGTTLEKVYVLTGWNSDKCIACYQTGRPFAMAHR
jgi:hypothetical protein